MTNFLRVFAWHLKFGQQASTVPSAAATPELIEFRRNLIDEEVAELYEALEARDVVAIAGELADLLYVTYGLGVSLGIDLDAVFAEVHRANMTKTYDPSRAKYDGKVIVKGPGFEPADIAAALGHQRRAA